MSDPYLAMIVPFAGNFAPRGWAFCQGQSMSISQNQALYALIGTTYGGDGQQSFNLPDLRGRMLIGTGQGPGLPSYTAGTLGGANQVTLNSQNLPIHTHQASFTSTSSLAVAEVPATLHQPSGPSASMLARSVDLNGSSSPAIYAPNNSTTVNLSGLNVAGTVVVAPAGSSLPVNTMSPFLAMNMIIAIQGLYPSRN